MRDRESGFTLIELLVTVAVISILAAIALPSFFGEARKAKASAEVQPMFNDLRVRLEQRMQENGAYPPVRGEDEWYPSSDPGPSPVPLGTPPASWAALRFRSSGMSEVRCRYTWGAGTPGLDGNVGPVARDNFGFSAPTTDWYYLLARCDLDGSGGRGNGGSGGGSGSGSGGGGGGTDGYSFYFTSSIDTKIRSLNDGS